jgi:hypothetical protein
MWASMRARFRRERAIFQQERSARIRWEREGPHVVRWEGAHREVPVVGMSSAETPGMARDLARDLARGGAPPPLLFEPGSDRLVFGGGEWALHPLADTAGAHYRYTRGIPSASAFPETGRELVLVEVRVEPRRPGVPTPFRLPLVRPGHRSPGPGRVPTCPPVRPGAGPTGRRRRGPPVAPDPSEPRSASCPWTIPFRISGGGSPAGSPSRGRGRWGACRAVPPQGGVDRHTGAGERTHAP